mgnify:CR=1 FL=1
MQKVVVFAVTVKHNIPRVFIKERHQNDDIKVKHCISENLRYSAFAFIWAIFVLYNRF